MTPQVAHLAVKTLLEPLVVPLRRLRNIEVRNSNRAKAKLGTPTLDPIRKFGPDCRPRSVDRQSWQVAMLVLSLSFQARPRLNRVFFPSLHQSMYLILVTPAHG